MKKLIPVLALLMLCFYSCKKEPKKTNTKPKVVPLSEQPTPSLPNSNAVATATADVDGAHYICPKNCIGGESSAEGTCPVCNSTLAHNQGFHNNPNNISTTPTTTNPITAPTSGPNAAGQYHYTCANGCAVGGDTVGKCSSCDGDLAHNAAYHN